MKMTCRFIAAAALLSAAAGAFAAKPTSIVFESEGSAADGSDYAIYVVKCSNGQQESLTAWNNRREWCVGKDSREDCSRKQISAAKAACK
ncbi:MAG: hypothetical protein RBS88_00605 [Spongiibacteraceae bacterium]|jgi:hypothetical protein|nr:hypothetical protein [Spongiibacteraceae bacterium]